MDNPFEGLTAVVTGAGSGLGRELAMGLAAGGARVIAVGRNLPRLDALALKLDGRAQAHQMDVTDREAWKAFASRLAAEGKNVDIIVNNAGVMPPVQRFTDAARDFDACVKRVVDTDFYAALYSAEAFAPLLDASEDPMVINISSASAFFALPGMSMYCAAKAALRSFSESLERETGWYVAAVEPGFVRTGLFREQPDGAMSRFVQSFCMPADRMARKILRGVGRRRRVILAGADARIMKVMHALLGAWALDIFTWVLKKSGIALFANAFPREEESDAAPESVGK